MGETVIHLPRPVLADIFEAAEAAYPEECCGLLVGLDDQVSGGLRVTRAEASPNLAEGDRRKSFLVDSRVQFDLMRGLRKGAERIIGNYHSHPDQAPEPSERDRQSIFYPDHVWLIVAVENGRAARAQAWRPDGGRFREIPLESGAGKPGSTP